MTDEREKELGLHYSQPQLVIRDLDHIDQIVAYIETISDDGEGAHITNDKLYEATLRAIAQGAPNAADLATHALKAEDIEFSRWYA